MRESIPMPKRTDIKSILIIGSGPIIIGQACEFDYSGTQACVALKEEGYRIILVNSNPATIMTDPSLADATYIEPITADVIEKIIALERPDAILATMGGQTALNCAVQLYDSGVLSKFNVTLIGASYEAIMKAENRQQFKSLLNTIGLTTPKSFVANSIAEAQEILLKVGLPAIIRPSFTLGGFGGGIVTTEKDYFDLCTHGMSLSPDHEIQIDESIYGWKEYELEVVRDKNDNVIVVCSIENIDPVGIHTGDSITVAPAQTLTDKEYQQMRDASIAIMRAVGVDTGGSNVQFAVNPKDGTMVVIEMNPRVSRSSALASKATGYPIARIAAKLAVGYTLDELANDITLGQIPAAFEPTLDYVVTKIPRFDLDKFPEVSTKLGSQMMSVGEVMAIGQTFQESLQKAFTSLETNLLGLDITTHENKPGSSTITDELLSIPTPYRLLYIADALRNNRTVTEIYNLTKIDPWFLHHINAIIQCEYDIKKSNLPDLTRAEFNYLKQKGFSDARIAQLLNVTETEVRTVRQKHTCLSTYKKIDSCAAEFATPTDYLYSSYSSSATQPEHNHAESNTIIIIGSGPNRIGQGIEFDYCCVQAVQAVREAGFTAVMINCNPETVSTDYNISNKLYFEPITFEKVMDVIEEEQPKGVIIQFGGQTPLKLVNELHENTVAILGSNHEVICKTEDRQQFAEVIAKLGLLQPCNAVVYNPDEALRLAKILHYPLIVRPSYVLGGRAMKIVYNHTELVEYLHKINRVSFDHPLLLEHFIDDAIEIDVDAVCDGTEVIICGVMEHVERAGVHSGDSACCFPTVSISPEIEAKIKQQMQQIALEIGAIGLINAQFAVKDAEIYVIEVNPRASRTVPFISKATGIAWVKVAVNCLLGKSLREQNIDIGKRPSYYAVKESVFPFAKLPGSLPILSPEMKSTGEVMGFGVDFHEAFYKAQSAVTTLKNQDTFESNKFILITSFDALNNKTHIAGLLTLITSLNMKIISDIKYQSMFENYNFACHAYFSNADADEIKQLIADKSISLIINLTGVTNSGLSSLFLFGVSLGINYTTTVPATYSMLHVLNSNVGYQDVKSIQAYYAEN